MISPILDRSNSYLSIFAKPVEIDKTLPKWKIMEENNKPKEPKEPSNINKQLHIIDSVSADSISLTEFLNFDSRDFNIYLGKKIRKDFSDTWLMSEPEFGITDGKRNSVGKKSLLQKVTRFFRKNIDSDDSEKEEVFQFDIFQFFDNVKGLLKDSSKKYIERIEPYMIALKQAQEMGQIALVDKLMADIFINKYESILFASDFYQKITEEQLVDFVKKAEKGVQLCYIKNFIRPIPEGVRLRKSEADKLLVFDNYCVLYYDKDSKSFSQTEAEKERERRKKSDPILFGMIHGSKNLYYIADWIDEYCNLTIDEFLKVTGLTEQHLKIDEKIKL